MDPEALRALDRDSPDGPNFESEDLDPLVSRAMFDARLSKILEESTSPQEIQAKIFAMADAVDLDTNPFLIGALGSALARLYEGDPALWKSARDRYTSNENSLEQRIHVAAFAYGTGQEGAFDVQELAHDHLFVFLASDDFLLKGTILGQAAAWNAESECFDMIDSELADYSQTAEPRSLSLAIRGCRLLLEGGPGSSPDPERSEGSRIDGVVARLWTIVEGHWRALEDQDIIPLLRTAMHQPEEAARIADFIARWRPDLADLALSIVGR